MIKFAHNFKFGTKAETLDRLSGKLSQCTIPSFTYFNVGSWRKNPAHQIQSIFNDLDGKKLVVRSSARREDDANCAMAGAFLSIANVNNSRDCIVKAVDEVIASYERDGLSADDTDQVLVQTMLADVAMSGVVFTQEINSGAPYYIINYDDESGRTDTVTSGTDYINRTLQMHRDEWHRLESSRFKKLIAAIKEIEQVVSNDRLDVEFVLDANENVHLLQVRQITTAGNWSYDCNLRMNDMLSRAEETLSKRFLAQPGVYGFKSIFGKMPDWNPAEMIGSTPRKLAFSLYRELITDRTWRDARSKMGYAEPKGYPLMTSIGGQPYIDVRLSFHSYLPKALPGPIASKLVDAWLQRLEGNPHLHDKVEFDVATTCLSFDFDRNFEQWYKGVLTADELQFYRSQLLELTESLICEVDSSISDSMSLLDQLASRRESLLNAYDKPELSLVNALVEDCIDFGTLPFSMLARHGFIASSMLSSLISEKIIGQAFVESLQASISTVAGKFLEDMDSYHEGEIPRDELMEKYGHLRPGTYDIRSPRYDSRKDLFERDKTKAGQNKKTTTFSLSEEDNKAINKALWKQGFKQLDAHKLMRYIEQAIKGREQGKFVFTRNISDLLEVLAFWGEDVGVSRDELSFLSIQDIRDCLVKAEGRTLQSFFRNLAQVGRSEHEITSALQLPMLITKPSDLFIVPMRIEQPNFITRKTVDGDIFELVGDVQNPALLDEKIIAIEGADPGYDWIFSRPILGLVTKFGGANSHMAIRCAELEMPAAIGCGEQIYNRLVGSSSIVIDCAEGRVLPEGAGQ